jgi:argininosuccinate lyase
MAFSQQQQQQPPANSSSGRLWGGRFTGITSSIKIATNFTCLTICSLDAVDPLMVAYNESIYFDRAFFAQDIAGSIAFARANVATGILTHNEFVAIEKGLRQILEEWRTNTFKIKPGIDEDIHTANERRLGEIIGMDIAGKLHTYAWSAISYRGLRVKATNRGRSRNDQIATDLRLWLRDELQEIEGYLVDLLKAVSRRAEEDIDYLMPGYTHLQRGQVIRINENKDVAAIANYFYSLFAGAIGCSVMAQSFPPIWSGYARL